MNAPPTARRPDANREPRFPLLSACLTLSCLACCSAGAAHAKLTIEITGGVEGAQPIAVVPFGDVDGAKPSVDIASVIAADLARSGVQAHVAARDAGDAAPPGGHRFSANGSCCR
jgi:TolB protein